VNGAAAALGFELEWSGEGVNTLGLDKRSGRMIVAIDPAFYRPAEVDLLLGNPQKAKGVLGWQAKTTLEQLTEMMAKADYDRAKIGIEFSCGFDEKAQRFYEWSRDHHGVLEALDLNRRHHSITRARGSRRFTVPFERSSIQRLDSD